MLLLFVFRLFSDLLKFERTHTHMVNGDGAFQAASSGFCKRGFLGTTLVLVPYRYKYGRYIICEYIALTLKLVRNMLYYFESNNRLLSLSHIHTHTCSDYMPQNRFCLLFYFPLAHSFSRLLYPFVCRTHIIIISLF